MLYTGCFGRTEIEGFIPPEPSILICIYDPEAKEAPRIDTNHWVSVSYHQFWDATEQVNPNFKGKNPYKPATKEQIYRIHQAIHTAAKCHIFASCEAGISRSAAVREYLRRNGYALYGKEQIYRMVAPNIHILSGLQRIDLDATA